MDVIGLAAEALKPISDEGTIVQQGWYDESLKRLHVTLWKLQDTEDAHSDDDGTGIGALDNTFIPGILTYLSSHLPALAEGLMKGFRILIPATCTN